MLEYLCPNCGAGHTPQQWRASEFNQFTPPSCPTCGHEQTRTLYGLPSRRNASQAIAHDVDCSTAYLVACVERDAQRHTDEYRAWATRRTQLHMASWLTQGQLIGGWVKVKLKVEGHV